MAVRITLSLILTVLWIGAAALHMQNSWPELTSLDAAGLLVLVDRHSAELAFFWLVLGFLWLASGYFQQKSDLRRTERLIQRAVAQAESATRRVETEAQRFDDYQHDRLRAAQPQWEIQGFITYREQYDISLRNTGAAASKMRVTCDQKLPLAIVVSNAVLVDRGQQLTIKVLAREPQPDTFELKLEYCDALGQGRRAYITVSELTVTIRQEEPVPLSVSTAGEEAQLGTADAQAPTAPQSASQREPAIVTRLAIEPVSRHAAS